MFGALSFLQCRKVSRYQLIYLTGCLPKRIVQTLHHLVAAQHHARAQW